MIKPTEHTSTISRILRYTAFRGATLILTVIASIYLVIMVVNLGGYLDEIIRAEIKQSISGALQGGWLKDEPLEVRRRIVQETQLEMEKAEGLDQPYAARCARWLYRGISLDWGEAKFKYVILNGNMSQDIASRDIRTIILGYLPRTLLLSGLTNFALFFLSIGVALTLARNPGSWANRVLTSIAPLSAIPSWTYGFLLYALFFDVLGIYSFKLGFNQWPKNFTPEYLPIILRSFTLPFLAIFLSKIFQMIYTWRTFFVIYANEDYVELARAKGLPSGMLERRHILRPALPGLLTSFALIPISIWQESIAVEYFFKLNGIGWFFLSALNSHDIPAIVALVVTFAYLLAFTVFLLDLCYAIVDPRVKIDNVSLSNTAAREKAQPSWIMLFQRRGMPSAASSAQALLEITRPTRLPGSPKPKRPVFQLNAVLLSIPDHIQSLSDHLSEFSRVFAGTMKYPTAIMGFMIILYLVMVSAYTLVVIPYEKAISLWRGDDKVWYRNPVDAQPIWTNWFRDAKLPENIILTTENRTAGIATQNGSKEMNEFSLTFPFDFPYDHYPQDITIFFKSQYSGKKPFVTITWVPPDGKEIRLKTLTIGNETTYQFSQDPQLRNKVRSKIPVIGLLSQPETDPPSVRKGHYQLRIDGITFDQADSLDAEIVIYGQVYGMVGTDLNRRDQSLILLWGTMIALSFGLLAAVGTVFASALLAAISVWFGGWVDALIQRITEMNMVLPVLPTSLMIFLLFSKSFWVILGVTVLLSIFGNSLKNYRAIFMQLRELPYIEAAQTYGASNWRIIFQYLLPRIRATMIPQFVILIPGYVFYEATLAYMGVSDPVLPTLGKYMAHTIDLGVFSKSLHITIIPLGLLFVISLGFSLVGTALERYYNEKMGV